MKPCLATLVVLVALPAAAAPRDRVLHEYVPPPGEATAAPLQPGQLPSSIRTEDRTLPQPDTSTTVAPGERTLGEGVKPDRSTSLQIDRSTQREGVLHYNAEFNPEVVPFKRMTSFDAVEESYRLAVRDRTLRAEPLAAGPTPPDRDAFWGSLMLQLQPGKAVPIPSVAPEARILSYRSTPPARFSFFRDSADNFWVSADQGGKLRLVFLTDAPRHYFSPQIPPTVTVSDVPARLRPRLPGEVQRAADSMLKRLELRRGGNTLLRQLDRLVAYFRAFEAGSLPPRSSGDTYLDIATSQRGVCRHRSFAFVVTAQALGIPARYVQNEAHAFTEVFVPRLGWARIDLGGASDELRVHNGQEKAIHDPGPDPFPKPARFSNSNGGRGTRMSGVSPARQLHRRSAAVSLRTYDRSGQAAPGETTRPGPTTPAEPKRITIRSDDPDAEEESEADQQPARRPTELVLFSPTRIVYRGDQVQVWGRVSSGGSGVTGLPVEIYLSRDGKTGEALLGTVVSGPEGRFRASLPVPRGVAVGDYQVFAATAGDARHDSSLSR
jgi:transglutaminase-like putative cysteine protease